MAKFVKNIKNFQMVSNYGKGLEVRVGIVDQQTHASGLDMAYLQAINHYGSFETKTPPRDVYIQPMERNQQKVMQRITSLTSKKTPTDQEFGNIVGKAVLEESVLHTFRTSEGLAPNKPRTIQKKGSASPLIDTGELMKAQNYKIAKKS